MAVTAAQIAKSLEAKDERIAKLEGQLAASASEATILRNRVKSLEAVDKKAAALQERVTSLEKDLQGKTREAAELKAALAKGEAERRHLEDVVETVAERDAAEQRIRELVS